MAPVSLCDKSKIVSVHKLMIKIMPNVSYLEPGLYVCISACSFNSVNVRDRTFLCQV